MRHTAQVDPKALDYELGLVYAKDLVNEDHPLLIVWRPAARALPADYTDCQSENTRGPVRAPPIACPSYTRHAVAHPTPHHELARPQRRCMRARM
jgi:hypothetical protein